MGRLDPPIHRARVLLLISCCSSVQGGVSFLFLFILGDRVISWPCCFSLWWLPRGGVMRMLEAGVVQEVDGLGSLDSNIFCLLASSRPIYTQFTIRNRSKLLRSYFLLSGTFPHAWISSGSLDWLHFFQGIQLHTLYTYGPPWTFPARHARSFQWHQTHHGHEKNSI